MKENCDQANAGPKLSLNLIIIRDICKIFSIFGGMQFEQG
jgi:hypothetical protein